MLYDLGNAPGDTYVFAPFPDEAVTLSLEDAKDAADDLLFETGLDAFEFIEGDKYFEYVNTVNFVEGADYMWRGTFQSAAHDDEPQRPHGLRAQGSVQAARGRPGAPASVCGDDPPVRSRLGGRPGNRPWHEAGRPR